MTARSKLFSRAMLLVVLTALGGCFGFGALAWCKNPPKPGNGKTPIHIEVQDAQGAKIAGTDNHVSSSAAASTVLAFDREYQPGDRILLSGPRRIAVRLDESMPECLLYLPGTPEASFSYEIPFGRDEQQTGSAYAPESFTGKSHRVTARVLNGEELAGYRNLALNPCDLLHAEIALPQAFPHASASTVSRNAFDFAARNAIDGNVLNGHHGLWPYQSWGPGLHPDSWWKVEFGRTVELDKIRLMERADFPHDSYWKSAVVEFSDGSLLAIDIAQSADFQEFSFPKRNVTWMRINSLVPADPTRWCSFIEVEAWGRDLP